MRPGRARPLAPLTCRPVEVADVVADALKVVVVYQDSLTRAWALDLWDKVNSALKNESVFLQSWRMTDLTHARVLPEAIAAAATADILLVSIRAATELPPALSVWVEGWIPQRGQLAGTLVALLGTSDEPPVEPPPVERYLQAVAQRARLDFMPRQRVLPAGLPLQAPMPPPTTERAPALAMRTPTDGQPPGSEKDSPR